MGSGTQKATGKINRIWKRLASKVYRETYVTSSLDDRLAAQIRALRLVRGWNQSELAERCEMSQSRVSLLENSCSNASLNSLKRIASAYDVGLSVKFVSFSELINENAHTQLDRKIPCYNEDRPLTRQEFSIRIPAASASNPPIRISTGASDWAFDKVTGPKNLPSSALEATHAQ